MSRAVAGAVTRADKARERAETWRAAVAEMKVALGETSIGSVSVSLGVAAFPAHGATGTDVLEAADRALYRAKSEGRNRVMMGERASAETTAGA